MDFGVLPDSLVHLAARVRVAGRVDDALRHVRDKHGLLHCIHTRLVQSEELPVDAPGWCEVSAEAKHYVQYNTCY